MRTINDLYEHINQEHSKRQKQIKTAIIDYFTYHFIKCHKPWRAIKTRNKCVTEPFYAKLSWPNLPEDNIRECIIKLGFVLFRPSKTMWYVTVPKWKKGEKLTFAQEWVKKINDNYTKYCAQEKERAKALFSEYISELISSSPEKIHFFSEYTLFEGFVFREVISVECARFMREMLKNEGIEEYCENDKYVGIIVRNNH